MNIDELHKEMTEYQLRVEEVLTGMDAALTDLSNRLQRLESGSTFRGSARPEETAVKEEIRRLDERVRALGEAVINLSN